MSGLLLGFLGGIFTGSAAVIGGIPVVYHDFSLDHLFKHKIEFVTGALLFLMTLGLCVPSKGFNQYTFLSIVLPLLCGLFTSALIRKTIYDTFKPSLFFETEKEEKAFFLLLFILFHNALKGFAIGSSMNIAHAGVNYSLLFGIALNNLFEGMIVAGSFLTLGLDGLYVVFGMLFFAAIEVLAGAFGGFLTQGNLGIIPALFSFVSGALMCPMMLDHFYGYRVGQKYINGIKELT